uniref:transposase n=1 Tax=Okeania sp. SIO2F4 TaxID=2607790 RepID=UPI00342CD955
MQLDNGGLHKALNLNIAENVILLFQPALSPQVNPIERLWQYIKEDFKWINFENIEELQNALTKSLNKLTQKVVAQITGWEFIVNA